MKKIFLSLLSLMGFGVSAFAQQSHINIEMLGATYTMPAVQFRVSWAAIPTGTCHNSKIWLWVDYIPVVNNQPSGSWTRATVANPSPGTVIAAETDKGFWLQGNSGSYSQTVTVGLTNILPNTTFNWCAYASDCPPFVIADNGTYILQGTPPFTLKAAGGATQIVGGTTLAATSLTIAAVYLTDKTECPSFFCAYTGSDLYRDETHLCGHRPNGAQNWEAYIKDSKDDHIYRITQFSDDSWWFTDPLAIADKRHTTCSGNSMYKPTNKPSCPPGWTIPTRAAYVNRWPDPANANSPANDLWGGGMAKSYAWIEGQGCNASVEYRNWTVITSDCTNCFHSSLNSVCNAGGGSTCSTVGSAFAARAYCMRN
ncbi:MAG: hypothetical protein LBU42_00700 [Prevotellaceae bacterium]|jgi:hypothetical protein|nr:hypothetical protein [Prevotellaceae bacterium]